MNLDRKFVDHMVTGIGYGQATTLQLITISRYNQHGMTDMRLRLTFQVVHPHHNL
jgi:hypothetical protein